MRAFLIFFYFFVSFLPSNVMAESSSEASAPQRIVSLAPSVTETLFALNAGDRLVGVTTYCDYPPAARNLPKIGTFMNPNVELVLAQRPDLVVAVPERADQERLRILQQMGLKVLVLHISNLSEIYHSIRALAQVVRREAEGETLVRTIQSQVQTVQQKLSQRSRRRVLLLVGTNPLVAVGPRSYVDELIALARGDNIARRTGVPWPVLNLEFVIAAAPEVIIEAGMGSEKGVSTQKWSDLPAIPAVKNGRVLTYSSDKILRPGPRAGEAVLEISRLIHPECFDSASNWGRCAGP
jgi:iron complex transport system substrate-binding protein